CNLGEGTSKFENRRMFEIGADLERGTKKRIIEMRAKENAQGSRGISKEPAGRQRSSRERRTRRGGLALTEHEAIAPEGSNQLEGEEMAVDSPIEALSTERAQKGLPTVSGKIFTEAMISLNIGSEKAGQAGKAQGDKKEGEEPLG